MLLLHQNHDRLRPHRCLSRLNSNLSHTLHSHPCLSRLSYFVPKTFAVPLLPLLHRHEHPRRLPWRSKISHLHNHDVFLNVTLPTWSKSASARAQPLTLKTDRTMCRRMKFPMPASCEKFWHRHRHETLARLSTWVAEKIYRNIEILSQIEKNSHVGAR